MKKYLYISLGIILIMIGICIIYQSLDTSSVIPWPKKELSSLYYIVGGGFISVIGSIILSFRKFEK